jgi:hypothetical protein
MTEEQIEKNLVLLVNTYYNIQEAADMILKEAENILKYKGRQLVQRRKQRHNELLRNIARMRNLTDSLVDEYGDAFGADYVTKTDEVRRAGNYLARVILQIADRCGNDDTGAKEQMIEEFIASMPDGGYLNEEIKNNFYLK